MDGGQVKHVSEFKDLGVCQMNHRWSGIMREGDEWKKRCGHNQPARKYCECRTRICKVLALKPLCPLF